MRQHMTVRWALAAVVALTALVGCGDGDGGGLYGDSTTASTDFVKGTPEGVTVPADAGGGAGWATDREGELWVLTYGSSTNPLVATKATADGQTVTVTLGEAYPGQPATNDLVPTTSYISVPDGVSSDSPVTVVLGDVGTAEILSPSQPGWVLLNS